jgi:Lrp/AsnC family transcriptional regulator for asnA, asnC and gidA
MVAIKANGAHMYTAAQQIAALPEVRWVVICAGSYDLLIEVVCADNQHLLSLISDKLSPIEGVRETVTFLYLDIVKRAQEWRLPD